MSVPLLLLPSNLPRAKYFISPGRRHGRPPDLPIPPEVVAATMAVISRDMLRTVWVVVLRDF